MIVVLSTCVAVQTTSEIGSVAQHPTISERDAGQSFALGGKIVWMFGDSITSATQPDGSHLITNTAAYADLATPTQTTEFPSGTPTQFIPFTQAESDFNRQSGGTARIALWPGSAILDGAGGAVIFFGVQKLESAVLPASPPTQCPGLALPTPTAGPTPTPAPGLKYTSQGVGLARLASLQSAVTRDPGVLFAAGEPVFSSAMVGQDGKVYVYASTGSCGNMLVGRVDRAQVGVRAAYTFWNGTAKTWDSDVSKATAVTTLTPSGSVSYNAFYHLYLMVYQFYDFDPTTGKPTHDYVLARTAPQPQGPWSAPTRLFNEQPPTDLTLHNYFAWEHPWCIR
jgi:hypothetical protein